MDVSKIEKPLVLYHGIGCRDGWCAAYVASLRWPDAELVPQEYGDPAGFEGTVLHLRVQGESKAFDLASRDVLMLDWSPQSRTDPEFTKKIILGVRERARSVLVLDHHEKQLPAFLSIAESIAESNPTGEDGPRGPLGLGEWLILDETRSGAGLALDWFFPGAREAFRAASGFTLPEAVGISYDRAQIALTCESWDLWRFDMPWTKEVCAFLDTVPRTIDAWRGLPLPSAMADRGTAVLDYQRQQVERIARHAYVADWPLGGKVNAVNSSVLQSEVGEYLYQKDPGRASLTWYRNERGSVVCSLRSHKEGPDVGEMSQRFGGGGHRHSSGFKLDALSEHENVGWLLMGEAPRTQEESSAS